MMRRKNYGGLRLVALLMKIGAVLSGCLGIALAFVILVTSLNSGGEAGAVGLLFSLFQILGALIGCVFLWGFAEVFEAIADIAVNTRNTASTVQTISTAPPTSPVVPSIPSQQAPAEIAAPFGEPDFKELQDSPSPEPAVENIPQPRIVPQKADPKKLRCHCGATVKVPANTPPGTRGRCPKCGERLQVS